MIKTTSFVRGLAYVTFTILLLFILIKTSNKNGKFTFELNGNMPYRLLIAILSVTIISSILYCKYSKY